MTHSCPTRRSSDLRKQDSQLRLYRHHTKANAGQDRLRSQQTKAANQQRPGEEAVLAAGNVDIGRRRQQQRQHQDCCVGAPADGCPERSEEHTSELQSLMRISYAVFCLKKKTKKKKNKERDTQSIMITPTVDTINIYDR